ncbi:MAG: ribose-phosphate diphosphokinase [Vulcanimicrobiota bacterium]
MKPEPLLLFAIRSYAYLLERICRWGAFESGRVEVKQFPDGERYQRILDDPCGRRVVLLGGTISDSDTLELYDLACALAKHGARSLTLVIPYFGYSTMERAVEPLEVVTSKTRARLLSAIPPAGTANRVIMVDLHAAGLPHYFEGGIRHVHLYAKPVVIEAARELGGDGFVLASTDAGRAKWVESLANDMGVPASFVFKRRLDGENVEITAVRAHVQEREVVIYDDMVRSGSSLLKAAEAYLAAGATACSAVTTHGVFPGESLQRIRESGLIGRMICTDTHPRAVELADDFLKVFSIANLLGSYLETLP